MKKRTVLLASGLLIAVFLIASTNKQPPLYHDQNPYVGRWGDGSTFENGTYELIIYANMNAWVNIFMGFGGDGSARITSENHIRFTSNNNSMYADYVLVGDDTLITTSNPDWIDTLHKFTSDPGN